MQITIAVKLSNLNELINVIIKNLHILSVLKQQSYHEIYILHLLLLFDYCNLNVSFIFLLDPI
jgi:hypothetical protein